MQVSSVRLHRLVIVVLSVGIWAGAVPRVEAQITVNNAGGRIACGDDFFSAETGLVLDY